MHMFIYCTVGDREETDTCRTYTLLETGHEPPADLLSAVLGGSNRGAAFLTRFLKYLWFAV